MSQIYLQCEWFPLPEWAQSYSSRTVICIEYIISIVCLYI